MTAALTNAEISENYRHVEIYMMRKNFTGQFARWVVEQSPYQVPFIIPALDGFNNYVTVLMGGEEVRKFDYEELLELISEAAFEGIPAVLALNRAKITAGPGWRNRHKCPAPDYDFIDLGALAQNVFYSIVRHHINWESE